MLKTQHLAGREKAAVKAKNRAQRRKRMALREEGAFHQGEWWQKRNTRVHGRLEDLLRSSR